MYVLFLTALSSCPHKVPLSDVPLLQRATVLAALQFSCTFSSPSVRTAAPPIAAQPPLPGSAHAAPWVEVWVRLVHDGKYLQRTTSPAALETYLSGDESAFRLQKRGEIEGMDALFSEPSVTIKGKVRRQKISVYKIWKMVQRNILRARLTSFTPIMKSGDKITLMVLIFVIYDKLNLDWWSCSFRQPEANKYYGAILCQQIEATYGRKQFLERSRLFSQFDRRLS